MLHERARTREVFVGEPTAAVQLRHSRWRSLVRWIGRGTGALLLLIILASYFIDEPLRRHMEAALNAELRGYAVHLGGLDSHPLRFALTFKDLSIAQKAHPVPPVARFPELHASVHWHALLHAHLVADFLLQRPLIHVDRPQLEHEAVDPVALKDKGWQQALETIYPLKVNHLRITDGDVTYIDDDPNRPLHVAHLNAVADNIRNVRSPDRVYPSDVRATATIVDSGRLRVDGKANFLAEPFAGFDGDVVMAGINLNPFKPILARLNLQIAGGVLSANGHVEYAPSTQDVHLKNVTLRGVHLNYVHTAPTAADEEERIRRVGRAAEHLSHTTSAIVRIDHLHIANSTVGYVDESSNPGYRVFLTNSDLALRALSNQVADGPASLELSGQFMGTGATKAWATAQPAAKSPDFDVSLIIEGTQLSSMNDLLRAFGNFDVTAGQFSLYSQLKIENGDISGYLKPIFSDVQVYSVRQDAGKPFLHQLYEEAVGGVQTVLRNPHGEVGTKVDITGRASDPKTSTWEIIVGLLRNAFIKAIGHDLEAPAQGKAAH